MDNKNRFRRHKNEPRLVGEIIAELLGKGQIFKNLGKEKEDKQNG